MGLKMKKTILIPGLMIIHFLISSQVAARNLKEGEVVRETNGVRDAKLAGDGGYFVGNIPGMIGGNNYPGIGGGIIPGIVGNIPPNIGGNIIPGIVGNIIPGIVGGGSFLGGDGASGYPSQAGYGGLGSCNYGCCGAYGAGYCSRCCTIN